MAHPYIERMKLIVGIDARLDKIQTALLDLRGLFERNVADPSTDLDIEDFSAGLSEIVAVTVRLMAPLTPTEANNPPTQRRTSRRGQTWELDGQQLTFNEIMERHPQLNPNTLRYRLKKVDKGGSAQDAVHRGLSVSARPVQASVVGIAGAP